MTKVDQDQNEYVDGLVEMMIAELRTINALRSPTVEAAMRAVPRHVFAPGVNLPEVYAPRTAVVTITDAHGLPTSSVSAPEIQAFMLEQARIEPGMRVLEIGSGGYNAALVAELVGPTGLVTTMDIDADVTDRATRFLAEAGYGQVRVVHGDAAAPLPGGPWDRVIVTVGTWDIPPSWIDQLSPQGRLVVPMRMRGITRSLALQRVGDHLRADSARVCGFVAAQGQAGHDERLILLHGDDIGLRFDDDNIPTDVHRLDGALASPRHTTWADVTVGRGEPFDSLELVLAAGLPGFCLLAAIGPSVTEYKIRDQDETHFRMAHVAGDAFAYLVVRPCGDGRFQLGAAAFGGHDRARAAEAMAAHITDWDRRRPDAVDPDITIWPRETPDAALPAGAVLDKIHRRIVLTWPPLATEQ